MPFQVIGPREVKEIWPLVELGGNADTPAIVGALYHPDDGHIAPADLTMALRRGARARGAAIYEQTEVISVSRSRSGEWQLKTSKGDIVAEHVVCATGNYARQAGGRELTVLRESDKSYYLREERLGWILGPCETGAPARFADGIPEWFGKSYRVRRIDISG